VEVGVDTLAVEVVVDMLLLLLHSRMHVGMTMEAEEEGTVIIVVVPDMEEDPDMVVGGMVVVVDVVVYPVAMR